ncbi:hypothetical protein ACA910_018224 [Epithemia clementina (nom. ined.)]
MPYLEGYGRPNHQSPASPRSENEIRTSSTMPVSMEESDRTEIRQSYSGNLLFRKNHNRSMEEEHSRSRAEDLCKRLELSDDRDVELHKASSFERDVKHAPSLAGNMMNVKQASALVVQNKQKSLARAEHDPLLTDRERLNSALAALRLNAAPIKLDTPTTQNTASTDPLGVDVCCFQTGIQMTPSFEENVAIPNATESYPYHEKIKDSHDKDDSSTVSESSKRSHQRVPFSDCNVPVPYYDYGAPMKKMTQAEKRAELARQTRLRLASEKASKAKIPEFC